MAFWPLARMPTDRNSRWPIMLLEGNCGRCRPHGWPSDSAGAPHHTDLGRNDSGNPAMELAHGGLVSHPALSCVTIWLNFAYILRLKRNPWVNPRLSGCRDAMPELLGGVGSAFAVVLMCRLGVARVVLGGHARGDLAPSCVPAVGVLLLWSVLKCEAPSWE